MTLFALALAALIITLAILAIADGAKKWLRVVIGASALLIVIDCVAIMNHISFISGVANLFVLILTVGAYLVLLSQVGAFHTD